MQRGASVLLIAAGLALAVCACGQPSGSGAGEPTGPRGTIRGHVRLAGTPPENPPIRMRSDPMCDQMNDGRPMVQEAVVTGADGGLANVFVQLRGSFPDTPAPREPVALDQRGCIYYPRVVGVQLGQTLVVGNSDPGLHNVHGQSPTIDEFNISQPVAGIVNVLRPEKAGLLTLKCDVHGWMLAFVHVVPHPYFTVTEPDGTFELINVPAGARTVRAWHERYGELTADVDVVEGQTADVDLVYPAEDAAQ